MPFAEETKPRRDKSGMSSKSALIIGATGATGKHVLRELIKSEAFTRVGEYGRRVTPIDQLGEGASKVEQKVIDFENLSESGLKDGKWDVVIITLGTQLQRSESPAMFEKIDREYVVNAARAAKTDDPTHKQVVVYCSSAGADAQSRFLYPRSKGLTENQLAESGYSDTIIFRPGYLANGDRPLGRTDIFEKMLIPFSKAISCFSFASRLQIDVSVLGKSIARAGLLGTAALPSTIYPIQAKTPTGSLLTVIGNKGAFDLANAKL